MHSSLARGLELQFSARERRGAVFVVGSPLLSRIVDNRRDAVTQLQLLSREGTIGEECERTGGKEKWRREGEQSKMRKEKREEKTYVRM